MGQGDEGCSGKEGQGRGEGGEMAMEGQGGGAVEGTGRERKGRYRGREDSGREEQGREAAVGARSNEIEGQGMGETVGEGRGSLRGGYGEGEAGYGGWW